MPWNHRIRKQTVKLINGELEDVYDIVEAYYNTVEDAENFKQYAYTEDSIAPAGSSKEDLIKELEMMLDAINRPVIEEEGIIEFIQGEI